MIGLVMLMNSNDGEWVDICIAQSAMSRQVKKRKKKKKEFFGTQVNCHNTHYVDVWKDGIESKCSNLLNSYCSN